MNATWAVRQWVASGLSRVIVDRVGTIRAWRSIRMLWLNAALDSREPPWRLQDGEPRRWDGAWAPVSLHARN